MKERKKERREGRRKGRGNRERIMSRQFLKK